MTDIGVYTPLLQIVSYWLDQSSKQGMYDRDKIWVIALRALTELNFDISAHPKTLRIPVNPNLTVPFPSDCLKWSKIGVLDTNGEISTLKINSSLTTYADNSPQRIQKLADSQVNDNVTRIDNSIVFSNFYYNNGCFNLYGYGNGLIQYGSCNVDERNQLVILPPSFRFDSILFEYISSPERDADYQVQTCLQEAIIAFIDWKMKLGTDKGFYAEAIKGRRRLKPVILQKINQVIRESQSMKLRS